MSERIVIPTAAGDLPGILWRPAAGSGPGLVLVQEIFGLSDYILRRGQDLADLGYVVLAPALFARVGQEAVATGPDMLTEAMGLAGRADWNVAVADAGAAVTALQARSDVIGGVGLVGYCYGGGLAFNVAATLPVQALVSYYGSGLPGLLGLAGQVTCPSLHHFGEADAFIQPDAVAQIRAAVTANPGTEFFTYPGADHAFDNGDFTRFHAQASELAWQRTSDFLGRVLPTS